MKLQLKFLLAVGSEGLQVILRPTLAVKHLGRLPQPLALDSGPQQPRPVPLAPQPRPVASVPRSSRGSFLVVPHRGPSGEQVEQHQKVVLGVIRKGVEGNEHGISWKLVQNYQRLPSWFAGGDGQGVAASGCNMAF